MLEFLAWALEELCLGVNLVSYKSPLDFTPKFGSSFGEGIVEYGRGLINGYYFVSYYLNQQRRLVSIIYSAFQTVF